MGCDACASCTKTMGYFLPAKNNTTIIVIRHHKNTKNFRAAKARYKKRSKKK